MASQLDGGWLSASEVLREFAANNPELEARWRPYWHRGDYVPEPEVNPVLWRAYVQMNTPVMLLDGYPRTYAQVDDFLQKGGRISSTILLVVEKNIALSRIVARSRQLSRFDDSAEVARRRVQNEITNLSILVTHREISRTLVKIDGTLSKTEIINKTMGVATRIMEGF
jgi:adenylate kinase family enzyme